MPSRRRPPLDVAALWQLKRIGVPTLSPDGAQACAPVTSYDMDKNEGSTGLWLFPTSGRGKPKLLTAGDKDSDPRWSPDGRLIAFTAKRKDDTEAQVYVIAPDGGEARRLTSVATGASAIKWFPDGKQIAFVSSVWPDLTTDAAQKKRMQQRKDDKVKAHVTERAEFRFWDHWLTDGREPHVFVCDIATGRSRDAFAGTGLKLPPWEPSADDFDIAPNGRELAVTIDPAVEPGMMNRRDIVTLDLVTRRKRVLTADSGMDDAGPVYSPDGRFIAHVAYNTRRAFNDQGHLRIIERSSGTWRRLAPRFDRQPSHYRWTPDGGALLMTVENHGRVGLYRLPLSSPGPTRLVAGGVVAGYAQSRDGTVIVFNRASYAHPPTLFACRADGGGERSIEALNAPLMSRHALGETREYTIKGWGGEPVQVWVTYPPSFDPKKKWPLMHSIHGGPHAAHQDGWHFRWNSQVFAGQGYVVAMVNYHGSSGFGQKFLETIAAQYG